MPLPQRTLTVVGADFPNRRGPGRRFEIEICRPGEPIELIPEPKNPADPNAVAVFSMRGIQIGYLSAERCSWMGNMLRNGREITAIFQAKASFGAYVRIAFDGEAPNLPDQPPPQPQLVEDDFWPDYEPPDD